MDPHVTAAVLKQRAARLGVQLPPPPTPRGSYTPAVVHNGVIYTSGVGPVLNGRRHHSGYVGDDVTIEQAQEAAAIAAVNALTSACAIAGGVESLERLIKVTGFVRSAPAFTAQTAVIDRASSVLQGLLGDRGTHARSAVGVAELPFGICVEIELIAAHRSREPPRRRPPATPSVAPVEQPGRRETSADVRR